MPQSFFFSGEPDSGRLKRILIESDAFGEDDSGREFHEDEFGILGCGGIAKRFAQALRLSGSGELHAAAARDEARAKDMIDQFGGKKAYGSYLDLVRDENVEIVYIALVHNLHYEAARLCVEHGKAVLCEKPFFITEREAVELASLAKEKGVLVMEAMWPVAPGFHRQRNGRRAAHRTGAADRCRVLLNFPFDPKTAV
jgi:hypothetical protein